MCVFFSLRFILRAFATPPDQTPNIPTVPPHSVHFARAIARPWVSTLGYFGHILVEEGLAFFMRYCGSKWVDRKVFKNPVEN